MGPERHDARREITEPFQSKGGLYNTFPSCGWNVCGLVVEDTVGHKRNKKAGTDEIRTREVSHHGLDRA
jgi:hypothetical protein